MRADYFSGKVAIVTGGASGIGRSLCKGLVRRGIGLVVVADINIEGANDVARAIDSAGGRSVGRHLDVTNCAEMHSLVQEVTSVNGHLDYMFNNAGIGVVGEVRDLDLEHWQQLLSVNLWGAIYGTVSAYQIMVQQRSGHIINISSIAGLVPTPLGTPYATSKHAVVGLSTSLRAEAAGLGVRVSVVCPAFVRTGIYDRNRYVGLRREGPVARVADLRVMEPDSCATAILRGVQQDKAIIVLPARARLIWWMYRFQPGIAQPLLRKLVGDMRRLRIQT